MLSKSEEYRVKLILNVFQQKLILILFRRFFIKRRPAFKTVCWLSLLKGTVSLKSNIFVRTVDFSLRLNTSLRVQKTCTLQIYNW